MAYAIPLTRGEFVVPDELIPNNSKEAVPCKFFISPAADSDQARIKSILTATVGLTTDQGWSPEVQRAVISAFGTGGALFVRTVDKIQGLSVPGWVAKKNGLVPRNEESKVKDDSEFEITTGAQFAQVYGYVLPIATLVAFEIGKISNQADAMDLRFFERLFGSSGTGTAEAKRSTVRRAKSKREKRATAASKSTK